MWKEIEKNGQYKIDCRLSGERTIEENINVMIDFATELRSLEEQNAKVRNRHEGYGILADIHQDVIRAVKSLKDGMGNLLNSLNTNDGIAVDKIESIASALVDVIHAATIMTAEARRVSKDLYIEGWSPTPLEEAAQDDDFEDPEMEEDDDEE